MFILVKEAETPKYTYQRDGRNIRSGFLKRRNAPKGQKDHKRQLKLMMTELFLWLTKLLQKI